MTYVILDVIQTMPLIAKVITSIFLVLAALSVWGITVVRVVEMRGATLVGVWLGGLAGVVIIALNIVVWW